MKICFVDVSKTDYNFNNFNDEFIRGAESIFINFSKRLSFLDNEVFVFNNCTNEYISNNYSWLNLKKINKFKNFFDIVISNNDTSILNKFNCKKKFVISHSILTIEKSIRKNQIFNYFRNRPIYLLIGKYHKQKMSKVFSFFNCKIISYGVDEVFEKKKISEVIIDNKISYFTSRQDRNLDYLVNIWKKFIFPANQEFKLYVTPLNNNLTNYNIFNRKMLKKEDYVNDLSKARIVILPGHKAELFCLAALEAAELCIPIVTMGYGSLSERVEHGVTGLIAKNDKEFSNFIIELFKNDDLWSKLRNNLISRRGNNSWELATKKFFSIIKNS